MHRRTQSWRNTPSFETKVRNQLTPQAAIQSNPASPPSAPAVPFPGAFSDCICPVCQGSGIAPFFPVPSQSSGIYLPFHILLFLIRIPLLVALVVCYFAIFSWLLPTPSVPRKVLLWTPFAILGIWLVDLRIDGVRRGYVRSCCGSRSWKTHSKAIQSVA